MTKMWKVALALIPVTLVSVIFFGFYSLYLVFATAISAVIFEYPFKKPENYLGDGSAFFAGMILGLTLSPDSPWWIPIVGAFILVVIAKQFFGGLGLNIFNPALVARGILLLAWPIHMVQWVEPFDTVSSATPLGLGLESFTNWDLFLGVVPGSIGETSALAIILGTIYLLYKGYIGFRIPLSYIISAGLMAVILGLNPIFTVLSGGLLFAAMYMATDPVTSPQEDKAKIVYGIGCGVLTVIIREYTPYPEGVTFAILMMNASAYLFDNLLGDYSLPRLKIKKKKLFQLSTILIASIVLLAVSISSYLLISNKTGGETKILIQNKMEEYFPEAEQFSIIHSENKRTVLAKISGEEDQVGYLSYLKTEGYINSIEKIFVCDEQGTIRTVEILKENESPTLGARISGKEFLGQFTGITVQNRKEAVSDLQLISGATFSSEAVIKGMEKSLQLIEGDIERSSTSEYIGEAEGRNGQIVVSVTIKDEQISDIEVVEHSETEDVIGDAFSDLAAEIINSQNLNVELVSGATYSSEGFLEAVEDALNNKQKEQ